MFSPSARDGQLLSLSSASAAGGNFRFATKVTKGAPKGGKTTVRSCFLSSLWNPFYLSTERGSPPRINAPGAYRIDNTAWFVRPWRFNIHLPQLRGNHLNAFANVSPRALAARRRSAIQRKRWEFPKREGKQPERVSHPSLARLSPPFRRVTKGVPARHERKLTKSTAFTARGQPN